MLQIIKMSNRHRPSPLVAKRCATSMRSSIRECQKETWTEKMSVDRIRNIATVCSILCGEHAPMTQPTQDLVNEYFAEYRSSLGIYDAAIRATAPDSPERKDAIKQRTNYILEMNKYILDLCRVEYLFERKQDLANVMKSAY
jgi:hypothetical protein